MLNNIYIVPYFITTQTKAAATCSHWLIVQKLQKINYNNIKWISIIEHSYINNSLHLARKYARLFVRGHYLFQEANSFPRAKLEEKCELRGTDNVQAQISKHIFAAKLRLLCLLSIGFKNYSFSWGIFAHVTRLDQSRASENIWWIIIINILIQFN